MHDSMSSTFRNVTILGATGTIGLHTLDVISQHPSRFGVFALTASSNVASMLALCKQHAPKYAVMLQEASAKLLVEQLKTAGSKTEVLHGTDALNFVSAHDEVDTVMAAIVGAAGLQPAMAAAHAGKRILLANKETLVMAGSLFMQHARRGSQ